MASFLDQVKTKYPNTLRVQGILVVGIAVFFGASNTNFDFLGNFYNDLVVQIGFWTGLTLIAIFIIFLLLETIIWMIPPLSPFFKFILNLVLIIVNTIKSLYIWLIKKLIEGAVEDIVLSKKSGQAVTYIFEKQERDDHYYPDIVKLDDRKIELSIQPSPNTKYWRYGIKFSKNEAFIPGRHGNDYPLIHLTKEESENKLRITYYNEQSQQVYNKVILDEYAGEEITLMIKKDGPSTRINVENEFRSNIFSELISNYSYGQIFAWGDSRPFIISSRILIAK